MDDETTTLPPGDITWDGRTMTAGGETLAPGRYRIAGTDYHLEYVDGPSDDELAECIAEAGDTPTTPGA